MSAAPTRLDPYKNFKFRVEIDGITVAGFSECLGFGSEVEVIEYREGSDQAVRKLPGLVKYSNIVLKRGLTQSAELHQWFQNIVSGQADRRNGSIVVLDDQQNEAVRWKFFAAFPCKVEGPELKASANDIAIETIELAVERLELVV